MWIRDPRFLLVLGCSLIGAATPLTGCSDHPTTANGPATTYTQDWQFYRGKYFFLVDPDSSSPVTVTDLYVYLDDDNPLNNVELGARPARAWLDPEAKTPTTPVEGEFHLLEHGRDYEIRTFEALPQGQEVLVLTSWVGETQVLAVAYSGVLNGQPVEVGSLNLNPPYPDTLDLKILHPSKDVWGTVDLTQSPWAPARKLELRNAYDLRIRNSDPGRLHVRIVRDVAGEGGDNPATLENEFGVVTPLIEVLGLDQRNNLDPANLVPDGEVDPEYIDSGSGVLFFPDLRPFDPNLADIAGTAHRKRSWPVVAGTSRPDTLGWYLDGATGSPEQSGSEVRDMETSPDLYDVRTDQVVKAVSLPGAGIHIYTLEATLDGAP